MNTYLVSRNLAAWPDLNTAHAINARDAEAAAEMFALLFMGDLETSVVTLAVRDIRDRTAGRVTVEITPTRNGEPEAIAIGSRFPALTEGDDKPANAPAISVGSPARRVAMAG